MKKFNIIIISESHFSDRIKCPQNFRIICRSEKIPSKEPRGGVAIFKNKSWDVQLEDLHVNFQDCAFCKVSNTDFKYKCTWKISPCLYNI